MTEVTILRIYRDHEIIRYEGAFAYRRVGSRVILERFKTTWQCVAAIDERLTP